jgi:hypothetical protein
MRIFIARCVDFIEQVKPQPQSNHSDRPDLAVMVDPFTGDGLTQRAGVYIRAWGQRGHALHPIAQPLPPLVLEQTALDFGQGQDR